MDASTLECRLQAAEDMVQRMQENILFQRQMIATLDRDGHDVRAAKMFLRQLEAKQAKQIVDRDRLFTELANRS